VLKIDYNKDVYKNNGEKWPYYTNYIIVYYKLRHIYFKFQNMSNITNAK